MRCKCSAVCSIVRGDQPTLFMDSKTSKDFSNIVKQYILSNYLPVADPLKATLHLTTQEVVDNMLQLYPNSSDINCTTIADFLFGNNYVFYDFGTMKFEWLFKKID